MSVCLFCFFNSIIANVNRECNKFKMMKKFTKEGNDEQECTYLG